MSPGLQRNWDLLFRGPSHAVLHQPRAQPFASLFRPNDESAQSAAASLAGCSDDSWVLRC